MVIACVKRKVLNKHQLFAFFCHIILRKIIFINLCIVLVTQLSLFIMLPSFLFIADDKNNDDLKKKYGWKSANKRKKKERKCCNIWFWYGFYFMVLENFWSFSFNLFKEITFCIYLHCGTFRQNSKACWHVDLTILYI